MYILKSFAFYERNKYVSFKTIYSTTIRDNEIKTLHPSQEYVEREKFLDLHGVCQVEYVDDSRQVFRNYNNATKFLPYF